MIKLFKFLCISLIVILSSSLFYLYNTNQSLVTQINNSKNIEDEISSLNDFESKINELSQLNKLYLLSDDEKYYSEYKYIYTDTIMMVNNLYEKNYISENSKKEIITSLDDYYKYSQEIKTNPNNPIILNDLLNTEKKVIDTASQDLNTHIEQNKSNNGNALNIVDNQNIIIEIVGGFISLFILTPLYFIKKNFSLILDLTKKYITTFILKFKSEDKENNKNEISKINYCNNELLKCINNGLIKNLNEKISDREMMISTLRMIYSHSLFIDKEYRESAYILKSIESNISELKDILNKYMNKSYIPYETINLIENKFLEVKFILERLPQYNEFIIKLTNKY